MRRLKVYFIHSTKFDYQNFLYKQILQSTVCIQHDLILPMTKNYQDKYTKDLMNKADIIVIETSNPSFGLSLELKWVKSINKPKIYLSLNNELPKKYQKLVPELSKFDDNQTYIKKIEEFITKYANITKEEQNDTTITLGEI